MIFFFARTARRLSSSAPVCCYTSFKGLFHHLALISASSPVRQGVFISLPPRALSTHTRQINIQSHLSNIAFNGIHGGIGDTDGRLFLPLLFAHRHLHHRQRAEATLLHFYFFLFIRRREKKRNGQSKSRSESKVLRRGRWVAGVRRRGIGW